MSKFNFEPCPDCGENIEPYICRDTYWLHGEQYNRIYFVCPHCHYQTKLFDSLAEAVGFWNTESVKYNYTPDDILPKDGEEPAIPAPNDPGMIFTPNRYQEHAMRTKPKKPTDNRIHRLPTLSNAALGLCGESGEFADQIKKFAFQGHTLEREHLEKELGDILWYVALACDGLGTDMETVMKKNILKLQSRYPDGFDSERSQNREEGDI